MHAFHGNALHALHGIAIHALHGIVKSCHLYHIVDDFVPLILIVTFFFGPCFCISKDTCFFHLEGFLHLFNLIFYGLIVKLISDWTNFRLVCSDSLRIWEFVEMGFYELFDFFAQHNCWLDVTIFLRHMVHLWKYKDAILRKCWKSTVFHACFHYLIILKCSSGAVVIRCSVYDQN